MSGEIGEIPADRNLAAEVRAFGPQAAGIGGPEAGQRGGFESAMRLSRPAFSPAASRRPPPSRGRWNAAPPHPPPLDGRVGPKVRGGVIRGGFYHPPPPPPPPPPPEKPPPEEKPEEELLGGGGREAVSVPAMEPAKSLMRPERFPEEKSPWYQAGW